MVLHLFCPDRHLEGPYPTRQIRGTYKDGNMGNKHRWPSITILYSRYMRVHKRLVYCRHILLKLTAHGLRQLVVLTSISIEKSGLNYPHTFTVRRNAAAAHTVHFGPVHEGDYYSLVPVATEMKYRSINERRCLATCITGSRMVWTSAALYTPTISVIRDMITTRPHSIVQNCSNTKASTH